MSISLIVMLGMPVLFLTGSLRKSTNTAGIGGFCFVSYFIICALLSLIPAVEVLEDVSISLAGTFMCFAPVIYLIVQRDFTFRFYLAAMVTVLISVTASFVSISYTVSYLSAVLIFSVSLISLLFLKNRAPLYAPVLIGIYSISADIMSLLTESVRMVTVFDVLDIASISFVACLAVSYLISLIWHRLPAIQT
jgi:hypothetical protein